MIQNLGQHKLPRLRAKESKRITAKKTKYLVLRHAQTSSRGDHPALPTYSGTRCQVCMAPISWQPQGPIHNA